MRSDHRIRLRAVAAALAAVFAASLFVAQAIFASPAAKTQMLSLPWRVSFQEHLAAPPALSWGDTLQATYTFTGATAGTADFVCTAVAGHFVCEGILRLPEGDIYTMTGPVDEKQPAAIIGGTRAYVGVTGQFTQQENGDDTGKWVLEVHHPTTADR
jgi:hypothetical protein